MSTPTNKVDFIYKLEGEPSEINVFELAPTLLALGELIQESNRALHPDGQEIAVNVKPFKEGSFIVDVVLFGAPGQGLLNMIQQTPPEQIIAVLATVGIVAKATTTVAKTAKSVLEAIRTLKGKPEKVEELKPGEYRLTVEDRSVTVGKDVQTLIQNSSVTQNIYKVYGKPLENEKIDDIQSYLKDHEETRVVVNREDAPALKEFASAREIEVQARPELGNEKTLTGIYLNPKRGAYDGEGVSWSFHRGDEVITATIKDQDFLDKVKSGEIRPYHKDLMTVTIIEKQKVVGTEVKRPTYEIIKVENYEKYEPPKTLFDYFDYVDDNPPEPSP